MKIFQKKNARLKMFYPRTVFHIIVSILTLGAIISNYGFVDGLLNPDLYAPVDMIKRNGYPVETYDITTPDGYVLGLQRIPYGKTNKNGSHFPILCIHGFIDSSFAWIANGPNRGLAYLLADQGYDVWMINVRGNTFSRNHTQYTANDPEFWNFSFDEIGSIDLPTTIDFILDKTNHTQLLCICDSAGNVMFYIMLSHLPQYNNKVIAQVSLALYYHPKMIPDSDLQMLSEGGSAIDDVLGPFLEHDQTTKLGIQFLSTLQKLNGYTLYDYMLYLVYGLRADHINREIMPSIYANFPAGTSFKVSRHLVQLRTSFSHYDHGPAKNLEIYGTQLPPEYNISNIRVPVRLYHAKGDFAATPQEVQFLYDNLPIKAGVIEIADPNFSHMDFLYNEHNNELFNYDVIQFVNNIVNYTLSHGANPNLQIGVDNRTVSFKNDIHTSDL
ncbi:lipase 3-like isoform X2 [Planococcus citri]|uniref:lipase 3-like isoform X2 n=1 Tax=Planococcus citri TaxID=170843 RepID=UPI0031F81818